MKKLFKKFVGMMVVMTMLVQMLVMTTTVFADDYSETVILSNEDFLNSEKWSTSTTTANISVDEDNVVTMVQSAEKGDSTGLNIPSGVSGALSQRYLIVNYDLKLSSTSISGYSYRLGTLNLSGSSSPLIFEITQSKVQIDGVWKHGPFVYFAGDSTAHNYVTDVSTLADWADVTFIVDYETGAQRVLINNELVASVDSMEGITSANYPTGFYFSLPNAEANSEMTYYVKDFSMKACDGDFGLVSTNLNDGAENVDVDNLEFEFSNPVSAEDLEAALVVEDSTGTEVADCTKTVTLSEDGKTAYVSLAGLTDGTEYTLTIPSTFTSLYDFTLAEAVVRSFTTPLYTETVILSNEDFLNSEKWSTDSTAANISVDEDNVLTMVQSSTKGDNTVLTLPTGLSGALSQRYLVVNYDLKISDTTFSGYNYRFGTMYLNGSSRPLTFEISQGKVSIDGVWKHGPYVYFAGDTTQHTYVTDVSTLADWADVTFIIDYETGAQRVLINNEQVVSVDSVADITSANYPSRFSLYLPNATTNSETTYYVKDFSMIACNGGFGLVSTNLNDGAVNVDVDNLEFEFSSPVSAEDLEAALVIEDSTGTEVADCTKTVTLSADGKTAYVSLAGLTAEATYTLTISSTFKNLYGFTIAEEVVRSFAPIKVYPAEKVIATTDYFADPDNCTNTDWSTTGNKAITYNEDGGYIEYFYSYENGGNDVIKFNIDDTAGSGTLVTKFKMFVPQNSYVYYNPITFTMDSAAPTITYKDNGLSAYSIDDVGSTLYSSSIYDKWLDITYIVDFDNRTQRYYLGEELILTENYTTKSPTKLNSIGFAMRIDSANKKDAILRLKDVSVRRVPGISPRISFEDRTVPVNQSVKLTFSTPVAQSSLTENLTLTKDGATLDNNFEVVMLNNGYGALVKFAGLEPNESYSVMLGSGLTDNYGQTLGAATALDFSTTDEVCITSDSYYSSSDNKVTGKVYINKPYDSCTGGVLIVAGYTNDGVKMVNLDTADIDFTTNDYIENPVDFEINDANNEITSVKCYIWNNLTEFVPLIDVVTIGLAQ